MNLTILSGGAAQGLVTALAPQFKAETGADVEATFGAVGAMRDKLLAGAPTDLLILTASLIAELTQAGRVVAGSAADLGAVATGVAVRSGDPAPAIGDADALRAALRAADDIYFPDPKLATAGIHFAKVLDRLGIANEMKSKTVFPNPKAPAEVGVLVAKGEAEIGVHIIVELISVAGIDLAGPLPGDLQNTIVFAAAVMASSKDAEASRTLVNFLRTPEAVAVIKAKGMEPATR